MNLNSNFTLEELADKVCVVMVTYNRCELLQKAILALQTQSVKPGGICIVNNASVDGTKDWLDNQDDLHIIHMSNNTGGAGGFHEGTKYAVELGYKFCWLFDDDAVAKPTALEELLIAHQYFNGKYGFLCSNVISNEGDPMNNPSISRKKNITGYHDWPRYISQGYIGIDSATFVSCFIASIVIENVGLPIKEMFIWGDDSEYTLRISKNYNCFMIGKSIVYHKRVNASSLNIIKEKSISRIKMYKFFYRNGVYNNKRYRGIANLLIYLGYNLVVTPVKIILCSENAKVARLKSLYSGLVAGLLFNPPICTVYPDSFVE